MSLSIEPNIIPLTRDECDRVLRFLGEPVRSAEDWLTKCRTALPPDFDEQAEQSYRDDELEDAREQLRQQEFERQTGFGFYDDYE